MFILSISDKCTVDRNTKRSFCRTRDKCSVFLNILSIVLEINVECYTKYYFCPKRDVLSYTKYYFCPIRDVLSYIKYYFCPIRDVLRYTKYYFCPVRNILSAHSMVLKTYVRVL